MLRSAEGVVVDAGELSHPGRDPAKQVNEDSMALAETAFGVVAVVCDGMGGHESGELASRTAVQRILEVLTNSNQPLERLLPSAIEQAHAAVYGLAKETPLEARPGSTAVVLALSGREALLAHVGDSRAYRVRARSIERLTRDHSVVEALLAAGAISAEQAKAHPDANRITRALGIAADIEPELGIPLQLEVGDVFVLCSDGLSDLVADFEIADCVAGALSAEACCAELVTLANQRGGHDNISVQVLRVLAVGTARRARDTLQLESEEQRTVVDRPLFTVLMGAHDASGPTATLEADQTRRTAPTILDPIVAARTASKTEPGSSGPLASRGHSLPTTPPASRLPEQERAKLLFWGAVSVCVLILTLIGFWSLLR